MKNPNWADQSSFTSSGWRTLTPSTRFTMTWSCFSFRSGSWSIWGSGQRSNFMSTSLAVQNSDSTSPTIWLLGWRGRPPNCLPKGAKWQRSILFACWIQKEKRTSEFFREQVPFCVIEENLYNFLESSQRVQFDAILQLLNQHGIRHVWDPQLIRGLDYYNDFCFEYIVKQRENLAQNAVMGGGRYDSLCLRFPEAPSYDIFSSGFAIGLDRMAGRFAKKLIRSSVWKRIDWKIPWVEELQDCAGRFDVGGRFEECGK